MRRPAPPALSGILLCSLAVFAGDAPPGPAPGETVPVENARESARRARIEDDWILQDALRHPARPGGAAVTAEEDAAGGCDGVKNGLWGFHTDHETSPWWQVDLGRVMPLDQVLIYNRSDECAERARHLTVSLSNDAETWREVYRHDGTLFRGVPDGKPLAVPLGEVSARFIRIGVPERTCLHLDEVEVYRASGLYQRNVALGRPASQSSASRWSARSRLAGAGGPPKSDESRRRVARVVERGRKLAAAVAQLGAEVDRPAAKLERVATRLDASQESPPESRRRLYLEARRAVREIALANPLLDFDDLLFVKRVPGSYSHMSDQYYGWFSRPGGGLYVLEGFKEEHPRLRRLAPELEAGSILRPDVSPDGRKVLFAYARFHEGLAGETNKLDKSRIPEDAFYHLYEARVDGSGLRRLTRGKYDHFDGRYLPNGDIVLLSTRRGQLVQNTGSIAGAALPDSYVRCGGGARRPVAVYTLHVMDAEGESLRPISPFENFEWTPSVACDGRILYARWDYIDRDNMPYMSLWSTLPDGTGSQAIFGNYTVNPYAVFEPRSVPGSRRIVFTASAHHSITGGSLVLLDPLQGADGPAPLTRLTPEVPFPEVEGWPTSYYANPCPLSEDYYLVAWSHRPLVREGASNPPNALGLYLFDRFGNLELLYRDPEISSMYPIPLRPRQHLPAVASGIEAETAASGEGRMLLLDVHEGLGGIERGSIRSLRVVGVPPKTQPTMNDPALGITRDDPGKFVLGTVPVEPDGSAFFRVPAGVPFFLQALDKSGLAVQTMRSVTYVQPGETRSCGGCHEPRNASPSNRLPSAARRPPSMIVPGPDGSWPLDFATLVRPVLDRLCVDCHGTAGGAVDLTGEAAYDTLISYGGAASLRDHVLTRYRQGHSTAHSCGARASALLRLLDRGHHGVTIRGEDRERLITWMDVYAQRRGSFSEEQEMELRRLRERSRAVLAARP